MAQRDPTLSASEVTWHEAAAESLAPLHVMQDGRPHCGCLSHVCARACARVCMYACTRTCMLTRVYMHVCVRMCVRVCLHTCVRSVFHLLNTQLL